MDDDKKPTRKTNLKEWIRRIFKGYWKLYKLQLKIGLIFAAIMGIYYLGWIFVGGIILMAVGAGMREAGQDAKAQSEFYNEQRIHRSKLPPKYWRK